MDWHWRCLLWSDCPAGICLPDQSRLECLAICVGYSCCRGSGRRHRCKCDFICKTMVSQKGAGLQETSYFRGNSHPSLHCGLAIPAFGLSLCCGILHLPDSRYTGYPSTATLCSTSCCAALVHWGSVDRSVRLLTHPWPRVVCACILSEVACSSCTARRALPLKSAGANIRSCENW